MARLFGVITVSTSTSDTPSYSSGILSLLSIITRIAPCASVNVFFAVFSLSRPAACRQVSICFRIAFSLPSKDVLRVARRDISSAQVLALPCKLRQMTIMASSLSPSSPSMPSSVSAIISGVSSSAVSNRSIRLAYSFAIAIAVLMLFAPVQR